MQPLRHLEFYDARRWNSFEDILCSECEHHSTDGECKNAVAVLTQMHSEGQDVVIPALTFQPDGERNGSRCPGMWPGEAYMIATGQNEQAAVAQRREDVQREAGMGRKAA